MLCAGVHVYVCSSVSACVHVYVYSCACACVCAGVGAWACGCARAHVLRVSARACVLLRTWVCARVSVMCGTVHILWPHNAVYRCGSYPIALSPNASLLGICLHCLCCMHVRHPWTCARKNGPIVYHIRVSPHYPPAIMHLLYPLPRKPPHALFGKGVGVQVQLG